MPGRFARRGPRESRICLISLSQIPRPFRTHGNLYAIQNRASQAHDRSSYSRRCGGSRPRGGRFDTCRQTGQYPGADCRLAQDRALGSPNTLRMGNRRNSWSFSPTRRTWSGAAALKTKKEKGRFVRDVLWNKSQATQAPILKVSQARGLEHRPFYIVNAIWVKADIDLDGVGLRDRCSSSGRQSRMQNLATRRCYTLPHATESPTVIYRCVTYSRAPGLDAGFSPGRGFIAGADTGIRWDHIALKPHYRGWNGASADHDYNWHDSIHSGGGVAARTPLRRAMITVTARTPSARLLVTMARATKLEWHRKRSSSGWAPRSSTTSPRT